MNTCSQVSEGTSRETFQNETRPGKTISPQRFWQYKIRVQELRQTIASCLLSSTCNRFFQVKPATLPNQIAMQTTAIQQSVDSMSTPTTSVAVTKSNSSSASSVSFAHAAFGDHSAFAALNAITWYVKSFLVSPTCPYWFIAEVYKLQWNL